MSRESTGKLRRCTDGVRRYAAGHRLAIFLAIVVMGVVGAISLLVSRGTPAAHVFDVTKIGFIMLTPMLLFAALASAPRWFGVIPRAVENRRADRYPQPANPPIERIAADLRRLLWEHHRFSWSNDYPVRAGRLWALEAAIGDCAEQAARALGVSYPDLPASGGLPKPQLRRLLRALATEGLVLPAAVELLTPDKRY